MIIHTDRGSQYSSNNFRKLLKQHGLRQSMSGKENCYDNAQAESFFARYKAELMENGMFEDVEQGISETFSYIEGSYNLKRIHYVTFSNGVNWEIHFNDFTFNWILF